MGPVFGPKSYRVTLDLVYVKLIGQNQARILFFIKIAILGADLVLCSGPKFGLHPGCSYRGQGGISLIVGAKGRHWFQINYRKLKISISHNTVILAPEPDAVLILN